METYYVVQSGYDGIKRTINKQGCDLWPFIREVSTIIAFGDCSNDNVTEIVFNGIKLEYVGWRRGMEFTYEGSNGETYTTWMEWLDH